MKTIDIKMTFDQYRYLVDTMNMAEDLCRANGETVPESMHQLLKQLLIAGLKIGWSKLPACFKGDKELLDAAGEFQRNFGEEPDPTTVH